MITRRFGVPSARTAVVGDRLYTDIACGVNAGIDTVLVLSGETKETDLAGSAVQPTFVLGSVADYLSILQE